MWYVAGSAYEIANHIAANKTRYMVVCWSGGDALFLTALLGADHTLGRTRDLSGSLCNCIVSFGYSSNSRLSCRSSIICGQLRRTEVSLRIGAAGLVGPRI